MPPPFVAFQPKVDAGAAAGALTSDANPTTNRTAAATRFALPRAVDTMSSVYNTEFAANAPPDLSFKAYEIEETVDIYFFRRLGLVVAHGARLLGMTPNLVSILAAAIGVLGGALLYDPVYAFVGFLGLVAYGVFDSADGQLARLTGQVSELGRVLDGVAGYATHMAIYVAIIAGVMHRGGNSSIVLWAVAAGICTAAQSQMYDYHRTLYARVVVQGRQPQEVDPIAIGGVLGVLVSGYLAMQRALVGRHLDVERAIRVRAVNGQVSDADRQAYRREFYRLVRGWNVLGDNGRRFIIGILVLMHHVEWFCLVILIPFNVVLAVLSLRTRQADDRFLAERPGSTG